MWKYYLRSCNTIKNHSINSCGCKKWSYGEIQIHKILTDNNIEYTHEKSFNKCRFPDSNRLARFDFYIKSDNPFLLEFDGMQHVRYNPEFWGGNKTFLKIKNHDMFKNKWAYENNIPLKRIPYKERENLTLDVVMSDKYLITPDTYPDLYPKEGITYPYVDENTYKK